jgi:hypothetical protein
VTTTPAPATTFPPQIDAIARRARLAAIVGGAVCLLGALLNLAQFLRSYLFAFLFWIGVAIGCLSISMIHHLSGGSWGLGIRRMLEAGARTLRFAWILFLPIALGMKHLYAAWMHPDPGDEIVKQKLLYLNAPFFLGRAVFYFATWALLAALLSRWSLLRDRNIEKDYSGRLQGLSGGGLVLMGLTITFASVDWAMSLNPHWFSTIYGILFMVGQVLSALALVIVLVALLGHERPLAAVITRETVHDLGKLLLAFVMLWAYISVSQLIIVWSANLPEEVPFYLTRVEGAWRYLAVMLVFFHFALPFLLLLSRDLKRNARRLAGVATFVLLLRLVDLYWLIGPDLHGHGAAGFHLHYLDFATPVMLGGIWMSLFTRELKSRPLLTPGDPELQEVLEAERA